MNAVKARRLGWMLAGFNFLLLAAGLILRIATSRGLLGTQTWMVIVYSILAAFILGRNPRHMVGWLFLVVGFFAAMQVIELGSIETFIPIQSRLVRGLLIWTEQFWLPAYLIPITFVPLFFPDGRLPSARWWPVPAATLAGMLILFFMFVLHPWPWLEMRILAAENPLAIAADERFFDLLFYIGLPVLTAGGIGCLAAVVVRYRRSRGVERMQIKWLAFSAVVGVSPLFILIVFGMQDSPFVRLIFLTLPLVLAAVIGNAILRYRLWDIDIIIRRTVSYALLTGLLALIYYGGLVILQTIAGALIGETDDLNTPIFYVLTTLLLAALFNPLRLRIQDFIDRRFYRQKYDAEQTLARFSAAARDEVDLEYLAAAILGAVEETLRPERANLWLKPLSGTSGPGRDDSRR